METGSRVESREENALPVGVGAGLREAVVEIEGDGGEEGAGYSTHEDDDLWVELSQERREMLLGTDIGFLRARIAIRGLRAPYRIGDGYTGAV